MLILKKVLNAKKVAIKIPSLHAPCGYTFFKIYIYIQKNYIVDPYVFLVIAFILLKKNI